MTSNSKLATSLWSLLTKLMLLIPSIIALYAYKQGHNIDFNSLIIMLIIVCVIEFITFYRLNKDSDEIEVKKCPVCRQYRPYPTKPGKWMFRETGVDRWSEAKIIKDPYNPKYLLFIPDEETEPAHCIIGEWRKK